MPIKKRRLDVGDAGPFVRVNCDFELDLDRVVKWFN